MRRIGSLTAVGLLLSILPSSLGTAETRSQRLPEPALRLVRGLEPEQMGVDSLDVLWTRRGTRVSFVAPNGALVGQLTLAEAPRTIDADSRWGVAALDAHGTRLNVVSPEGRPVVEIELPDEAAHLAWLDAGTVALGLTRSDRAVEIRSLRGAADPVRLWPVAPPGLLEPSFLHSIVLDADPGRKRLYALDSVYGELRVFTYGGKEVRRLQVTNPMLAELEQWLADTSKAPDGPPPSALYTVLRLAVGDGEAWVVRGCDPGRHAASVQHITESGSSDLTLALDRACCSRNFTVWQDALIFNHKASGTPSRCIAERSIP